jgi:hypothetical protein
MKKIALLSVALVLLAASAAQAEMSIQIQVYPLLDNLGNYLTTSSKTLAVVDKDGDGLTGFNLSHIAPGTSLTTAFDSADWIVTGSPDGGAVAPWNDPTDAGYPEWLNSRTYGFDGATQGVSAGQHVFLFWFPGLDAGATTLPAGQTFGVMDLYALDAANGVLPPNTGGYTGFSHSNDLSREAVTAEYSVTPEPATMLLLAAGGVATAIRRRRHAA